MSFNFVDGPIIACSSGSGGNSAIAIIRISGFKDLIFFSSILSPKISQLKANETKLFNIKFEDIFFDQALVTYFAAPKSYNGENILELSVHGNFLNVERIIKLFIDNLNVRHALPGEFSYRALVNGKLSLSQVEGLDLLLNATSGFILNLGQSILSGEIHQSYLELREDYIKLKSSIELHFDFLDDVGEEAATTNFYQSLGKLTQTINLLHQRTGHNSSLLNPSIVIAGSPNAGKSSLFNQLLGFSRSIVSPIEGTTRDFISEYIRFGENQFQLIDTAGVRKNSQDVIENMGMNLALSSIEKAFYKILVINPFSESNNESFRSRDFDLTVFTHTDRPEFFKSFENWKISQGGSIGPHLFVNALSATNYLKSKDDTWIESGSIGPKIQALVLDKFHQQTDKCPILQDRQRTIINSIYLNLNSFIDLVKKEKDMAILSHELKSLGQSIEELIGITNSDEVLDSIFKNFCIGK